MVGVKGRWGQGVIVSKDGWGKVCGGIYGMVAVEGVVLKGW